MFDGWKLTGRLTKAAMAMEAVVRERGSGGLDFHICPGTISETASWAITSYASWQQTSLCSERKLVTDGDVGDRLDERGGDEDVVDQLVAALVDT